MKGTEGKQANSNVSIGWITLPPYTSLPFAWTEVLGKHELEVELLPGPDGEAGARARYPLDDVDKQLEGLSTSRHYFNVYLFKDGIPTSFVVSAFAVPELESLKLGHESSANLRAMEHRARQDALAQVVQVQTALAPQVHVWEKTVTRLQDLIPKHLALERPYGVPPEEEFLQIKVNAVAGLLCGA